MGARRSVTLPIFYNIVMKESASWLPLLGEPRRVFYNFRSNDMEI